MGSRFCSACATRERWAPAAGKTLAGAKLHTARYDRGMCRNIRPLFNFAPPVTEAEVAAAALQYVRKVSGSVTPSAANREAFDRAVAEVARVTRALMDELVTTAPPRDRDVELERARERAAKRFGPRPATRG
jgi:hypothetical protein